MDELADDWYNEVFEVCPEIERCKKKVSRMYFENVCLSRLKGEKCIKEKKFWVYCTPRMWYLTCHIDRVWENKELMNKFHNEQRSIFHKLIHILKRRCLGE